MSRHEAFVYTCDGCGDVETVDVDEPPLDWIADTDGNHYCGECA